MDCVIRWENTEIASAQPGVAMAMQMARMQMQRCARGEGAVLDVTVGPIVVAVHRVDVTGEPGVGICFAGAVPAIAIRIQARPQVGAR